MKKMETLEQPVGCSLWIVWLVIAMLLIEWVLLSLVFRALPLEQISRVALWIIMGSIIATWIAVFIRVERKKHEAQSEPQGKRNGNHAD